MTWTTAPFAARPATRPMTHDSSSRRRHPAPKPWSTATRPDRRDPSARRPPGRRHVLAAAAAPIDPDFHAWLESVREELSPAGVLESMLVDRIARSAWRLRSLDAAEDPSAFPGESEADRAARDFDAALAQFRTARAMRPRKSEVPSTPPAAPRPEAESDPTHDRVLARVAAGWDWDRILDEFPELAESDLRRVVTEAAGSGGGCLFV